MLAGRTLDRRTFRTIISLMAWTCSDASAAAAVERRGIKTDDRRRFVALGRRSIQTKNPFRPGAPPTNDYY
jgi:hypothetical protein